MLKCEDDLRETMGALHYRGPMDFAQWEDYHDRPIFVTEFPGAYGFAAGVAIVVEGSPPRGIIISIEPGLLGTPEPPEIFFLAQDRRPRRLSTRQALIVRRFLSERVEAEHA